MTEASLGEAELLTGLFSSLQTILTIVSLFFAIVSGYMAALFFFLARASLFLRSLAFALLTIGLSFLGGTAAVVQSMQEGLLQAWARLPSPVVAVDRLRNPMPGSEALPLSQQELGVLTGWIIGIGVYAALAYLTFVHDWSKEGSAVRGA
ncbi:MAG: hypothetical protein WC829_13255 [Hyphomicrobium sp.]|jgi:hypothetical protein